MEIADAGVKLKEIEAAVTIPEPEVDQKNEGNVAAPGFTAAEKKAAVKA